MVQEQLILKGLMGSRSVGTETPESDYDFMGIVLAPEDVYLGVDWWGDQGTKEYKTDQDGKPVETTIYEFTKFLRLCQNFNPNVIPLLWLREKDYFFITEFGYELIANRTIFNSKRAWNTFSAYAHNQLKKMINPECPTGQMGAKRKILRDKYGYDTKYAYHTLRLSFMLREFLESDGQVLNVYRKGIDSEYLIDIRNGKCSFNYILETSEKLMDICKNLAEKSNLPEAPDKNKIRDFCRSTLRKHLTL